MRQISNKHLMFALVLCGLFLWPPFAVKADPRTEKTEIIVRDIIERQMAAFKTDNAAEAFSYAAQNLRGHFGSPEKFIEMVKQHYTPVFKPSWYQFDHFEVLDGIPMQAVMLQGQAGFAWLAIYHFDRQPDQNWKIAGVSLHKLKGSGA